MRQSRSVQLDSRSACNFVARLCCTLARQNRARKLQVWHHTKSLSLGPSLTMGIYCNCCRNLQMIRNRNRILQKWETLSLALVVSLLLSVFLHLHVWWAIHIGTVTHWDGIYRKRNDGMVLSRYDILSQFRLWLYIIFETVFPASQLTL